MITLADEVEENKLPIPKNGQDGATKPALKEFYARDVMTKMPYNILDHFIPSMFYENPDPVVRLEGTKGLGIYADMCLHPVISACWNLVLNTITGMDWDLIAASSDQEDVKRADFIDYSFHRLNSGLWNGNAYYGGFPAFAVSVLDAWRMGFSGVQAIWNLSEARIEETTHEIPQSFLFLPEKDSDTRFNSNSMWTGTKLHFRTEQDSEPIPAPPYKFMHFIYKRAYGVPQGESALRPAYWPYVFGFLEGTKMWVNFLDTWGSPNIIGLIEREDWGNAELKREMLNFVSNYQRGYRGTLPALANGGNPLQVVESNRSSSHTVFSDFYNQMNRLIASALVGSPLVMLEAEFGTRAHAQVQNESVFRNFVKGWSDWFMAEMQTPIQWQIDLKFGRPQETYTYDTTTGQTTYQRQRYPGFKLKYEAPADQKTEVDVDTALIKMGAKIPLAHIHNKYNRPQAQMIKVKDPVTGQTRMELEPIATLIDVAAFPAPESTNGNPSTGEEFQINDNLKNMTGRQQQQFLRVIRQHSQGKITLDQASILLRNGFGFGDEEVKAILGIEETEQPINSLLNSTSAE